MKNKLFHAYCDVLRSKLGTGYYGWEGTKSVEDVAHKMFEAISKGGRMDWLKHNQALKEACRSVGIQSSMQLREQVFGMA